ncbi:MAG: SPOR domain-containing protein, partial [Alphaproteobacteria bacterium]
SSRRGALGFFAVLIAFGFFAGVVWIAYEEGMKSGEEAVIPVVHAEAEPIKTKPEQPGGMDVPFQDKLVYGQLTEKSPEPEMPRLLPPPEEPVALPEPVKAPEKTEILQEMEAAEVVVVPVEPAPEPAAVASPPEKEAIRIQIAALKSEEGAKAEWAQLQKAQGDLLSGLTLHIERADLGEKGVFFRVQAGPLGDVAAARALCEQLQQRKLGCLVVRP